jgi:hypothetical protein
MREMYTDRRVICDNVEKSTRKAKEIPQSFMVTVLWHTFVGHPCQFSAEQQSTDCYHFSSYQRNICRHSYTKDHIPDKQVIILNT